MTYRLVLTNGPVEKNNGHIARLENTNGYLQRVLQSDASLENEVKDLFYFEQKGRRWRKFVPFCSWLREDHDARSNELTDILNGMDLLSVDEVRRSDSTDWLYFGGDLEIELRSKEIGDDYDQLNLGMRMMGHFLGGVGVIGISEVVYGLTTKRVGESIEGLIAGVLIGGMGVGILICTTTPKDYTIALEKAQRADAFLRGEYDIVKNILE